MPPRQASVKSVKLRGQGLAAETGHLSLTLQSASMLAPPSSKSAMMSACPSIAASSSADLSPFQVKCLNCASPATPRTRPGALLLFWHPWSAAMSLAPLLQPSATPSSAMGSILCNQSVHCQGPHVVLPGRLTLFLGSVSAPWAMRSLTASARPCSAASISAVWSSCASMDASGHTDEQATTVMGLVLAPPPPCLTRPTAQQRSALRHSLELRD